MSSNLQGETQECMDKRLRAHASHNQQGVGVRTETRTAACAPARILHTYGFGDSVGDREAGQCGEREGKGAVWGGGGEGGVGRTQVHTLPRHRTCPNYGQQDASAGILVGQLLYRRVHNHMASTYACPRIAAQMAEYML